WRKLPHGLSLDHDTARGDPNALAEASLDVPAGQYWLEVRAVRFPSRMVALAPSSSSSSRTRVFVVADDHSEPAFDPVDVMVSLGNRRAEAVMSYLSRGALMLAGRLGDSLVDQVEDLIEKEKVDPISATVAGYYLLKASALDKPHDWTAKLAGLFA